MTILLLHCGRRINGKLWNPRVVPRSQSPRLGADEVLTKYVTTVTRDFNSWSGDARDVNELWVSPSVERRTVRVKCLVQEHNAVMSPAGLEPGPLDPETTETSALTQFEKFSLNFSISLFVIRVNLMVNYYLQCISIFVKYYCLVSFNLTAIFVDGQNRRNNLLKIPWLFLV